MNIFDKTLLSHQWYFICMTIIMPTISKNNSKENKKNSISSQVNQPKREIKMNKYQSAKKAKIKRRTSDLTLSRASATAIASQANHAKKATTKQDYPLNSNINNSESSKKIPLRVRVFFWCSLLLFSISFYQAVIRPQLEVEIMNTYVNNTNWDDTTYNEERNDSSKAQNPEWTINLDSTSNNNAVINVIQLYFERLSNRDFDGSFELFIPALQRSSEIREHFTPLRMNPFLDWIEGWKLSPSNFQYISTSTYWRDKYDFSLSYTLSSTKETYNETWEFVVDTKWDTPKITSMVCTTPKCSYHPIFRPENFGLMK